MIQTDDSSHNPLQPSIEQTSRSETPTTGEYQPDLPENVELAGLAVPSRESGGSSNSGSEICDFCLYDGEGNFTSYGYPLPYRPSLNCSYRVLRIDEFDTCELELTFHDFDLSTGDQSQQQQHSNEHEQQQKSNEGLDCTRDYLEVSGQRFCGSQWAGKTHTVAFPAEWKELTFR